MKRTVLLVALSFVLAGLGLPPEPCCAQTRSSVVSELATIDANTRWALRAIPEVTVGSSIVRLGDVVRPLDAKLPLWTRLKSAPIAMFPVNSKTMKIDRDRLDKAIRKTEATPRSIDWFGPSEIKVTRVPNETRRPAIARSNLPAVRTPVTQTAYQESAAGNSQDPSANKSIATRPTASPIDIADANRVIHWIKVGIDREQPLIAESFDVDVDPRQPALSELVSIAGVTMVEPIDAVDAGTARFRITGRSSDGPVEAIVAIELTKLPRIVVPRTTLGRGHRITERDLKYAPVRPEKMESDHVTDLQGLVGMEVRSTLRANQPVVFSHVGSPILIHRGDLVELRVLSGGVTVKTNAKALGDGSESDLVEVETMRPRKRLVARVVQTGLVEIVTRAPAVRYREQATR